jgi:hypothetical protein
MQSDASVISASTTSVSSSISRRPRLRRQIGAHTA